MNIMRIIIYVLIGTVPLLIGHMCEALLNIYDLIKGDCRVRNDSKYMEYLWIFFTAVSVLFTICLMILVFIVLFNVFKTGIKK